MVEATRLARAAVAADGSQPTPRVHATIDEIRTLLQDLSPDERKQALNQIKALLQPIHAPRAGDVLGAVVRLVPARRKWTISEIKSEVAGQGIEASDKEVYNAVGYLTRGKHLKRVGYGQYLFEGGLLVTADNFGGEPVRNERPDGDN
ncbi:MAG TPA: hypothetical protein VJR47_13205 [Stellaceae bacterium]|nr:hypothetical protein [Stellaceae bacterium]